MRTTLLSLLAGLLGLAWTAQPVSAQYQRYGSNPATGEKYRVEVAGVLWNPDPSIVISSEQFEIPGTEIDFVQDLGIEKSRIGEFRVVLRPARKHKFRVSYTPIDYEAETTLARNIVFNGILYPAGVPVSTTLDWKTWRLGYEWDFFYRDRGFVGLILEAKVTDVRADIVSPLRSEFTSAKAPIPAVGGIVRGYIFPNVSITGEVTGFKLPGSVSDREEDSGSFLDYDIYGTLNFAHNFGVQAGYRRIDVTYVVDQDYGDLILKGFYMSAVIRF